MRRIQCQMKKRRGRNIPIDHVDHTIGYQNIGCNNFRRIDKHSPIFDCNSHIFTTHSLQRSICKQWAVPHRPIHNMVYENASQLRRGQTSNSLAYCLECCIIRSKDCNIMKTVDCAHLPGLSQSADERGKVGSRGCGRVGSGDSEDGIDNMKDTASKVDILWCGLA
jgi:hypothetical protein